MESGEVLPDAVRTELARILASSGFCSAPKLREFLRFVVEESLAGRSQHLKEYAIGTAVYHKDAS